jgi:hypothetical protein
LISCIAEKKARLFRVLSDDFTLNLNFYPCSGQTACLCYKTSDKERKSFNKTSDLPILCDNPRDAFICARHKTVMTPSRNTNKTEDVNTLIILTSALEDQIGAQITNKNVNSLSFYVNINEKYAKIDSSSAIKISEFWKFHYKSLDQRVVKLLVSSCGDNVQITNNNLEEIAIEETIEGLQSSSIWEMVTTYLYNTGNKALNVATTALKILAGVLEINIWGSNEPTYENLPSIDGITCDTDATTKTTSPSTTTTTKATTTTKKP